MSMGMGAVDFGFIVDNLAFSKMKKEDIGVIEKLIVIFIIVFGIFIAYHLLRLILGGVGGFGVLISLNILIITFLFVIFGFAINLFRGIGRTENGLKSIKEQFSN